MLVRIIITRGVCVCEWAEENVSGKVAKRKTEQDFNILCFSFSLIRTMTNFKSSISKQYLVSYKTSSRQKNLRCKRILVDALLGRLY